MLTGNEQVLVAQRIQSLPRLRKAYGLPPLARITVYSGSRRRNSELLLFLLSGKDEQMGKQAQQERTALGLGRSRIGSNTGGGCRHYRRAALMAVNGAPRGRRM